MAAGSRPSLHAQVRCNRRLPGYCASRSASFLRVGPQRHRCRYWHKSVFRSLCALVQCAYRLLCSLTYTCLDGLCCKIVCCSSVEHSISATAMPCCVHRRPACWVFGVCRLLPEHVLVHTSSDTCMAADLETGPTEA